jgi:hypothetical protein
VEERPAAQSVVQQEAFVEEGQQEEVGGTATILFRSVQDTIDVRDRSDEAP